MESGLATPVSRPEGYGCLRRFTGSPGAAEATLATNAIRGAIPANLVAIVGVAAATPSSRLQMACSTPRRKRPAGQRRGLEM